eukprot:3941388-Rhodomonas_salina.3
MEVWDREGHWVWDRVGDRVWDGVGDRVWDRVGGRALAPWRGHTSGPRATPVVPYPSSVPHTP